MRSMSLVAAALLLVPWSTHAQSQCRTWASVPGGASPERDSVFARCAVTTPARPLPSTPMPPAPQVARALSGQLTVVVNTDGGVDTTLTRWWSHSPGTGELMETVRRWRFEPAVLAGVRVRNGYRLYVLTDERVDTLPMRLEWTYAAGGAADTLRGAWHERAPPPPLTDAQQDSIHLAALRRLVSMHVVEASYHFPARCIVSETRDSAAQQRFNALAARVLPGSGHMFHIVPVPEGAPHAASHMAPNVAPPGCERRTDAPRVVLQRVHRTEEDRAVTYVAGDLLLHWPPGFEGQNWRAWRSRCVSTVPDIGPADVACDVLPEWPSLGRAPREPPTVVETLAPGDSLLVTLVVTTTDAFRNDTLRFTLHELPRFDTRLRMDPERPPVEPAHAILRTADLRPATGTGEQLWLRVHTDPVPRDVVPVMLVHAYGRWSTWPLRPRGTGVWDFQVNFDGPPGMPPAEYRLYLVVDRP